MFQGRTVAVVVPALNEETAIAETIASVPTWVDRIVVVDDASTDDTVNAATHAKTNKTADPGAIRSGVEIVRHSHNRGVGAAIVSGYRRSFALGIDITVVMAGDGQMDPADLPALIKPLVNKEADYAKGNRFLHPDIWKVMPRTRLFGNVVLSLATKLTSGFRDVFDSQCGYTAINYDALAALDLDRVFSRYGYPNDVLARLHSVGARVVDVCVRPVYGPRWKSGIRPSTVVYPVSYVLVRSFLSRIARERGLSHRLGGRAKPVPGERDRIRSY